MAMNNIERHQRGKKFYRFRHHNFKELCCLHWQPPQEAFTQSSSLQWFMIKLAPFVCRTVPERVCQAENDFHLVIA